MATTEERLAALEAKLAALTATTPTEYYTHQYSGEEIDAAVGRALTGGALDTSVTNVSNQLGTFVRPNLLDNWYFGRPVNQRGETEYTGSGYTIDRWMRQVASAAKTTVGADGLILDGEFSNLDQYIDPDSISSFRGQAVTMSILSRGHVAVVGEDNASSYYASYAISGALTPISVTFRVKEDADRLIFHIQPQDDNDAVILAAKLELGPTQTLAHKEGERWVLNEVPDYGEQLRRCLRYCRILGGSINNAFCFVSRRENTRLEAFLPFDVAMRVAPSLVATGDFMTIPDFIGVKFSGVDSTSPQGVSFFFSRNDGGTFDKDSYLIYGPMESRITISADL